MMSQEKGVPVNDLYLLHVLYPFLQAPSSYCMVYIWNNHPLPNVLLINIMVSYESYSKEYGSPLKKLALIALFNL